MRLNFLPFSSLQYGYKQKPHIDYNYDIASPINLLQKRESQDSDFLSSGDVLLLYLCTPR